MHASSYIRYLEMSKSCKIDTNSYSETGSLCSSDARKELNLAPILVEHSNCIPIY